MIDSGSPIEGSCLYTSEGVEDSDRTEAGWMITEKGVRAAFSLPFRPSAQF